jgi:hypothetical protein
VTTRELQKALETAVRWVKWDREVIDDFHEYAHRFGGQPGANVYTFALRQALASHGLTLEQFRRDYKRKNRSTA